MSSVTPDLFGFFGHLFVRRMIFPQRGDWNEGHRHQFDHVTMLSHGAIEVAWRDPDGRTGIERHTAPAFIDIPAARVHQMTALENDTQCWCLFVVRDLLDSERLSRVTDAAQAGGIS